MHLVGVRRELADEYPWLLKSVYAAFQEAAKIAFTNLSILQASKTMLPWLVSEFERTRELMGDCFWPYGVKLNRHVLEWTLDNLCRNPVISSRRGAKVIRNVVQSDERSWALSNSALKSSYFKTCRARST
jgi:hypothetical protein